MPQVQYKAEEYHNAIDWKTAEIFEPPMLRKYSDQEILDLVETPLVLPVEHNTQYVEPAIRVMSEKSKRAASLKRREGKAISIFQSRSKRPKCETKKDFQ